MERRTQQLLAQAEGRAPSRGGTADSENDDIFGFGAKAISEDTLREMRRQNEANMARAMATLRGGSSASGGGLLPAVHSANRSSGAAAAVRRPPRRKQPPGGFPRPETPSEVREAAERELSQRARERVQAQAQRQPQHRPPKKEQKATPKPNAKLPPGASASNGREEEDGGEHQPMHTESRVLFSMLDWQKECRVRNVDSTEILKQQPRAMYDKEIKAAKAALQRHNRILRDYLAAVRAAPADGESALSDIKERATVRFGDDDSSSVAPSHSQSMASALSATPSQTRVQREQRLQELLDEGRDLRQRSLDTVRRGGVDVVNDKYHLEQLPAGGRNILHVLHSLLETGLADDLGLNESGGGAAGQGVGRGVALRKLMLDMQAHERSLRGMQVGKKRPYDDPKLQPSHMRQKRARDWQMQVKVYASWDEESSGVEVGAARRDAVHAKTMMLLRASEKWVVGGDDAEDNLDLETKLEEIQRRNKRMARMALRTQASGPARFVLYDSDESEEDLYAERRAPARPTGRKARRLAGNPYRQQMRVSQGGYAPDSTLSEEDPSMSLESDGGDAFAAYLPQDRRRLREIAAVRKKRMRNGRAQVNDEADMSWVNDVLPSVTEDDGEEEVDYDFMGGPLAKTVSGPMAKLQGEAWERHKNMRSMEQRLLKMKTDAALASASSPSIGQTQERIYKEVHKIRRLISGEVREIFADIAQARQKLADTKTNSNAEHRDLLTQEAQRLLIGAEMRANALRDRYRQNPDMNIEFMPEYLRSFLTAGVSAQTMFDRGRLQAVQARAEQLRQDEQRREERAARRRKLAGGGEEELSEAEVSDGGVHALTTEEKLYLKELLADARQLNVILIRVDEKTAGSSEADGLSAMEAADAASEAAQLLEQSMQMHRALRRKLKSIKAKRLRPLLPLHLRNLMKLNMPLQTMWRDGFTEPAICEALEGLNQINSMIAKAKALLIKFENGEALTQEEEDEALKLLEKAIVDAVAVREHARAAMLDVSIGGSGLSIKRFPKHVVNLIVSEESVVVLWEKGLIDMKICHWLDQMTEINVMLEQAQRHKQKASVLGQTPKGLEELAQVDTLEHEADVKLTWLRRSIDNALVRGLSRRRLPPHLLAILNDRRAAAILFRLGKLDPVMALFEQHASRLKKARGDAKADAKRAQKLMDAENRQQALLSAGAAGEAALEDMLKLRAQVLVGGILPSEAPPGSALAALLDDLEEEMEAGEIEEGFMQRVLEQLDLSQEMIDRLKKVTRERRQVVIDFHEIEWESLIGRPGAYLPKPERPDEPFGIDISPVEAQTIDKTYFDDGLENFSGVGTGGMELPVQIEWVETELERPQTGSAERLLFDETMSNLPVLDDPHPKFKEANIPEPIPDADGDDGPTDAGMTETDVYIEQKERKQTAKKYDSDDDEEPDRIGKKKKMANVARGDGAHSPVDSTHFVSPDIDDLRLEGKARSGIPVDVRRKIADLILEAKKSLKIDISDLELPYIPKQVLDCLFINSLTADRNLLDEVDPALGRMGNLTVLSLSWNRIESPLPLSLWELNMLKTLNLDHNQIDEIPADIEKLSSLTKLRLDANNLEQIPPQMGERTNLKYLALDRNNLVDLPKEMKQMKLLSTLTMSRNALTFVPKCVFNMNKLKVLHVHQNEIPMFPTELEKLKHLTDLNFAQNLLTDLPEMISRLVTLKKLDVSKNEIRFIGPEIEKLVNLEFLAISYNLFQALPEELRACTKMTRLNLNANKLSYLPQDLTRLAKLEVLDLRNNSFIAITPQIGRMSAITSLRVDGNEIHTPPPYVCDLETKAMLRYLDRIDTAILTGEIDYTSLSVPPNRVLVQKGYTSGRRVIKDKFKTLPEVPVFLHNCGFQFPHGMWTGMGGMMRRNMTSMTLAGNGLKRLDGNELAGYREKCLVPHMMKDKKVPEDGWVLDPLSNLQKLQLQANRLEDLPTQIEYLTALTYVDLTSNSLERLSGPHIAPLTNLRTLNLHNNPKLRRLPNEMGLFDRLTWLDVTQCMLISPPPVIVQRGCRPIINYLRKLYDARFSYRLDLDGEKLFHVPIDVTEHTFLTELSLRDNGLTVLPPGLGAIAGLFALRLESNFLAHLPVELGLLTGLTELGLGRNMLQGIAPETLLQFQNMRKIDLCNNHLRALPRELAELTRLTDLDASSNALPTLPFELHRLTNLTRLRLHRNVLKLPLKDLADVACGPEEDIGVLLEFLRTCANAQGDKHKHHKIPATRHLDLSRRPYKIVPSEVLRITTLTTLKLAHYGMENMLEGISQLVNLTLLELHDNRLRGLPDSMQQLTGLQRLSLGRNWLCRLPYCLTSMQQLKDLQVEENQLSVIFADIQHCSSLTELNARGNCLRQLTPALVLLTHLQTLDVSENQIPFVPKEMGAMTHLVRLSLKGNYIVELPLEWCTLAEGHLVCFDIQENGLKSPPPEILARGSELVFEYLRRFHLARVSGVLDLSDMGLTYLPAEVMRFYKSAGVQSTGLKRLILDGNRLGWLPNYLRTMTTLTHLSLKNCGLTKLPYCIGDLRDLTRIDLQGNDIQSPPDEIIRRGVHAMVRYMRAVDGAWWTKVLDISGQRFENVPVEICDVDSLTSLKMHSQYFTDIPLEIGRLSALTHLDLQHCHLVEMPETVGQCYNLRELILNNNKLVTMPAGLGSCTALTSLRLHENLLEELPTTIGACTLLQDLRLFNNNLLHLPLEVGNMCYLPALRVSSNQLGELTIGVGGLDACCDFLAAENYLESLPSQIGLLTNITRLRVTNNRITALPSEIGNLCNMTELGVSDNQLRELPALGHLTALRNLEVANNPLTVPPDTVIRKGTFAIVNYLRVLYEARGAPAEIVARGLPTVEAFHEAMQQGRDSSVLSLRARLLEAVPRHAGAAVHDITALTELDLECNVIADLSDARLGDLVGLRVLKLSYNQLLALPNELRRLTCLTVLEACYNFLPAIPPCICALPLQQLVLDSNEIREVPDFVAQLTGLTMLSLTNNSIRKISEVVPARLTKLDRLLLQRNELMTLPPTLMALQALHTLDLSFNQLYALPTGFAELSSLRILRLAYNDLEFASMTLDGMHELLELRLTSNRLAGIPHTFAALKKLEVFHIGGNIFPLEPQHHFLRTWEATQKWLRLNFDAYVRAQTEKTGLGVGVGGLRKVKGI